jgi:hypothetical protein
VLKVSPAEKSGAARADSTRPSGASCGVFSLTDSPVPETETRQADFNSSSPPVLFDEELSTKYL